MFWAGIYSLIGTAALAADLWPLAVVCYAAAARRTERTAWPKQQYSRSESSAPNGSFTPTVRQAAHMEKERRAVEERAARLDSRKRRT